MMEAGKLHTYFLSDSLISLLHRNVEVPASAYWLDRRLDTMTLPANNLDGHPVCFGWIGTWNASLRNCDDQ